MTRMFVALAALTAWTLPLFGAENAAHKKAEERAGIERAIAVYVEAQQKGTSGIMRPVFHPAAQVFMELKVEPIHAFFDLIDQLPPSPETTYEIVSLDSDGTIGMARVELFNCYGMRFTDMFVLVRAVDGWKIACKVSRRHP